MVSDLVVDGFALLKSTFSYLLLSRNCSAKPTTHKILHNVNGYKMRNTLGHGKKVASFSLTLHCTLHCDKVYEILALDLEVNDGDCYMWKILWFSASMVLNFEHLITPMSIVGISGRLEMHSWLCNESKTLHEIGLNLGLSLEGNVIGVWLGRGPFQTMIPLCCKKLHSKREDEERRGVPKLPPEHLTFCSKGHSFIPGLIWCQC